MTPAGRFRWVVLTMIASTAMLAAAARAQSASEAEGLTRPSEERKLSFSIPGLVKEALVKEGDRVKTGDPILQQDDVIDKKELERLELAANSKARIEAAEADLGVKRVQFQRKLDANAGASDGAKPYSDSEIEEAQNDVTLREKQLEVAREDNQEAKIRAEQQAEKLRKMRLDSPIDGIVEKLVIRGGEWADPQSREGAAVVVKNDPLYLEVREVRSEQVAKLKMGQKLQVRYRDDADKPENWQEAEVFYFASVADGQSDTRLVKLRLANPHGRPAGLWMAVKLPADLAATSGADGLAGTNR